jgi:putative membrane protein
LPIHAAQTNNSQAGTDVMKNPAKKFLTPQEYEQVDAAVRAAEKRTSGEIVCMIQGASYHYPMAHVIGAAALALPIALILTPLVGAWLWLGTQNMWIFISILATAFAIGYGVVKNTPGLKRLFISAHEIAEEVEEAAVTNFFRRGLYRTRENTGILLFISVFERKVWVLADRGINAKMEPGWWDALVAQITNGIRTGQGAAAICQAVDTMGRMLEEHFPVRADDTDELDNVIVADT